MLRRVLLLPLLTVALFLTVSSAAPDEAEARGGPFGLGVIIGGPTGLTGKYMFGQNAIDFHLGLSGLDNGYNDRIGLYADYLWQFPLTSTSAFDLPLYLGPGLGLIFETDDDNDWCPRFKDCDDRYGDDDDLWLGVRMPIGIAMFFKAFPGELFLELSFSLFLIEDTFFDIDGAIGFRFYF